MQIFKRTEHSDWLINNRNACIRTNQMPQLMRNINIRPNTIRGFPYVERAVFRVSREAVRFQFYWLFFFFNVQRILWKALFFRSIWNLFALVGFSKTSTAFDLRASLWLDKKKVQINSKLNSNSYYYLEIVYSNHKPTVTDVLNH